MDQQAPKPAPAENSTRERKNKMAGAEPGKRELDPELEPRIRPFNSTYIRVVCLCPIPLLNLASEPPIY